MKGRRMYSGTSLHPNVLLGSSTNKKRPENIEYDISRHTAGIIKDYVAPTATIHYERVMSPEEQKVMSLINFLVTSYLPNTHDGFYKLNKKTIMKFLRINFDKRGGCYGIFASIFNNALCYNIFHQAKDIRITSDRKYRLITSLGQSNTDDSKGINSQTIEFQINEVLLSVMLQPTIYGKVKLIMLSVLESNKYTFAIYEFICDRYYRSWITALKQKKIKSNKHGDYVAEVYLKIDDICNFLGFGDNASYRKWQELKKNVLVPCFKEICEKSDFKVEMHMKRNEKQAQRIIALCVTITPQQWEEPGYIRTLEELEIELKEQNFKRRPSDFKNMVEMSRLTQETAKRFIFQFEDWANDEEVSISKLREQTVIESLISYGEEGVSEIFSNFKDQYYRRKSTVKPIGIGKDVSGYLARCLLDGFGVRSEQQRKDLQKQEEARKIRSELAVIWEKLQTIKEVVIASNKARFESSSYKEEEIQPLKLKFEQKLLNDQSVELRSLQKQFREDGWFSDEVQQYFTNFLQVELFPVTDKDCKIEAARLNLNYEELMNNYKKLQQLLQN